MLARTAGWARPSPEATFEFCAAGAIVESEPLEHPVRQTASAAAAMTSLRDMPGSTTTVRDRARGPAGPGGRSEPRNDHRDESVSGRAGRRTPGRAAAAAWR